MRKLIAYVLVIVGVIILIYPKASEWYDNRQQEKLLALWEEQLMDQEADMAAQAQYDELTTLFAVEALEEDAETDETADAGREEDALPSEQPETAAPAGEPAKLNAIASIRIPSIKLNLPVLAGATQSNMKYAAAHLKETTPLGGVGNAAIAAHRMRKKGSLFNRLNEVKAGDQIIIETKEATYTYTVYKTSIVEPHDVSVLNYNNTDRRLTLITCDPVVDPTHRLIVHAEMT